MLQDRETPEHAGIYINFRFDARRTDRIQASARTKSIDVTAVQHKHGAITVSDELLDDRTEHHPFDSMKAVR